MKATIKILVCSFMFFSCNTERLKQNEIVFIEYTINEEKSLEKELPKVNFSFSYPDDGGFIQVKNENYFTLRSMKDDYISQEISLTPTPIVIDSGVDEIDYLKSVVRDLVEKGVLRNMHFLGLLNMNNAMRGSLLVTLNFDDIENPDFSGDYFVFMTLLPSEITNGNKVLFSRILTKNDQEISLLELEDILGSPGTVIYNSIRNE